MNPPVQKRVHYRVVFAKTSHLNYLVAAISVIIGVLNQSLLGHLLLTKHKRCWLFCENRFCAFLRDNSSTRKDTY